jgi:hypothetical protein
MTIINDPDQLDRFQVVIDPLYKIISVRGSGGDVTGGPVQGSAGSGTSDGHFIDSTNNFVNVVAGDILAITSDPNDNGGVMGHYKVASLPVADGSGLILDRAITQTGGSGVSYRVYKDGTRDVAGAALADGVTMQALYSFLKEEWRDNSLSASGEDLIKYTFPMVSITSEQFEIGGVSNSNWEFADDSGDGSLADESPRNLIRTGGWASINNSGQIIENYPSIVTLGSLGSASQVYYQLTSATTDPNDFVLTGAVNQSIRTLETIGGATVDGNKVPSSGVNQSITFTSADSTIDAGSTDLFALGFTSGELVQVRQSANNNGLFTITSSGAGATDLQVTPALTSEAGVTCLLSPLTDNRDYLVLRVRTKGQSYAQSEIADIGVSQINTIVNRFPLAESADVGITLSDGQLGGDGTTNTDEIQEVETFNTNTDGVIGASLTDGTFTFTSAGAGFLSGDTAFFDNNILQPGDSIEIANSGFMEIKSIDSDTQLTVFYEPTGVNGNGASDFQGGGTAVTFTTKTATIDSGSVAGTLSYTAGSGSLSLTDTARTFNANGGLGQRTVASGNILEVTATDGEGYGLGYYRIETPDANSLTCSALDIEDKTTNLDDIVTYRVLDDGMFLQYKKVDGTASAGVTTITSNTLDDADFTAANGYIVGAVVTITNADVSADNGTYVITNVATNTITLITLAGASPGFTSTTVDVAVEYGFIRDVAGTSYSFNWRLFANNGTLSQCFQFLQRELRRATDIDGSSGTSRGDITDLLMTYTAPNGVTLNLFLDNVNPAEKNNITQQDLTGTGRDFDFSVTLRIALNSNITNATNNKIVVFFSDLVEANDDGLGFGTSDASIVQDENGVDMSATNQTTSPKDFVYNYTSGGDVDRDITVVCITDDTGQYVQATSQLTEDNIVNVSLVAGLERNYSNP